MSLVADVDGLRLTMPEGWWVWKYDDSAFYRKQFQNLAGGSKAMDAVALADDGTLWLIEIKDYRRHRRTKPSSVFAEVASKVRATLAGLATARVRANDQDEKTKARQAMTCRQIRVAMQLVQSVKPSKLFPQVVEPHDAQIKLRQAVKAVDPHPLCAIKVMNDASLPWQTEPIPN
ncbi:MAG: hypothetical protein KJ950_00085 [Proteobacteria bacterium]|nr:hypothetical protein [Pseudomonadota bacterium]MBU1688700.1 hypothetical protein [Pseudomonadota bacterium]